MTSDNSAKYNFKSIIGYIVPIILTALFLYFAFKDTDLDNILSSLANVSIPGTMLFVTLFLLSHFFRAVRWKYIIRSVKPDVTLNHLFGATMVGYGVNCVVPRLGEIYRSLFLGKWEGMHRASVLGTIIVERVIDILALGFSVLLSVMIYSGDLFSEFVWLKASIYIMFLAMFVVIILLVLLVKFKEKFYNVIVFFVKKISEKLANKLANIFKTLTEGFTTLRGRTNILYTLFYTVLIMFLYGVNAYVGFYMLRMDEIQNVTLGMGWILMTISAFGVIIPTPGGTGSYHFITTSVLVVLFGFNKDIAGAYALLTHFISFVLFVGLLFVVVQLVNKQRLKAGYKKETFISVFKIDKEEE